MRPIYFKLLFLILLIEGSCEKNCDSYIDVYEGSKFKKGQEYILDIESGDYKKSETFWANMSRGKYEKLTTYCTAKDSILVKFTLDKRDTSFYISSKKTHRLLIGSYYDGTILIATD